MCVMCLTTIHGWCMELRSESIPVTFTRRGEEDHISRSAWALASEDFRAGLVGVGIRGASTGEATGLCLTTTIMSPTAGPSSIGSPVMQVGTFVLVRVDLHSATAGLRMQFAIALALFRMAT